MKNRLKILTVSCFLFFGNQLVAQTVSKENEPLVVDDIQIDVKKVSVDAKTKIASVELFLISYAKDGRELKLNTFATQLVDSKAQKSFYATMSLEKVMVKLADRQNYINYLMEEDKPVSLKITVSNWVKMKGKPKELILVFEDSEEEGHFIETSVQL